MSEKHRKMSTRDRMAAFIRSQYRKPVLDHFFDDEYLFYPYDGAPDPFACIVGNGGRFVIIAY